jgi:hypothetical protein
VSLDVWVRAKGVKDEAKERLERLPASKTGKGVRVPFPYVSRDSYKRDFTNEQLNSFIASAPKKKVQLSTLHAIQHSVQPERLEEYIDHPGVVPEGAKHPVAQTPIDRPVIIHYKGVNLIHDGHHRSSASLLSGEKSIEVRYVDLDKVARV